MITGFEDETHELTEYEFNVLLPALVSGLKRRKGKHNAVKSTEAIKKLKAGGFKISPPRWRKVVHHIRVHHLVGGLISTSKGYYIAETMEEVETYRKSLRERINSIQEVHDALEIQENKILEQIKCAFT